mgnify:CR=1 FL=1
MELQWLGMTSFRLAGEPGVVLCDPPAAADGALDVLDAEVVLSHLEPGVFRPADERDIRLVAAGPGQQEDLAFAALLHLPVVVERDLAGRPA